ncbi:MAG: Rrf2 family transcriptional regulator [Cyanobacteriota bacterium]|nr:Rrf2 family transcriptional regulator [Cyanobacteriota bacterium]
MTSALLLGRIDLHAVKALLELAGEPERWRSANELAQVQNLPAALLEQLLLRLRRAGLLEARRGRQGGYRLAAPPAQLRLSHVLAAIRPAPRPAPGAPPGAGEDPDQADSIAGPGDNGASDRVAALLQHRLRQAIARELERITLQDLLYDLHSARACLNEDGGLLLG